jgi:RimJ/RimL family protein N-acetyltransferase
MPHNISVHDVTVDDLRTPVLSALLHQATLDEVAELDRDGSATLSILRDQTVVGMACLKADGEIMACVAKPHTQQGIATEACRLVLRRAFESKQLERVYARARIGTNGEKLARRLGLREYNRDKEEVFLALSRDQWVSSPQHASTITPTPPSRRWWHAVRDWFTHIKPR